MFEFEYSVKGKVKLKICWKMYKKLLALFMSHWTKRRGHADRHGYATLVFYQQAPSEPQAVQIHSAAHCII